MTKTKTKASDILKIVLPLEAVGEPYALVHNKDNSIVGEVPVEMVAYLCNDDGIGYCYGAMTPEMIIVQVGETPPAEEEW